METRQHFNPFGWNLFYARGRRSLLVFNDLQNCGKCTMNNLKFEIWKGRSFESFALRFSFVTRGKSTVNQIIFAFSDFLLNFGKVI